MKKLLLVGLIFSFYLTAKSQSADTLPTSAGDSIDIHALVQKQIDKASKKQSLVIENPTTEAEKQLNTTVEMPGLQLSGNSADHVLFSNLPLEYKLFASASFAVILFIFLRRVIIKVNRRSLRLLKEKIEKMRGERIGSSKGSNKQMKARKILKSNPAIFNEPDIQLNKIARRMNLSKGELHLATRLRSLEVKKMQEVL